MSCKFNNIFLCLFIVIALSLTSCQNAEQDDPKKLKVAFVYNGLVGDAGWTYMHDQARKEMEKNLYFVETTYMENVSEESADTERVFSELCEKGNKIIFGTSYGYMDAMVNVAQKYPQVVFQHCGGYKTSPNLGTYWGKIEQPMFLTGIIAGKMTKKNKIGYVASHPIPEVIRMINAFTIGVRQVNPKVSVYVIWLHTWFDPGREKEGAESLLDTGVDIIAQNVNSTAPQQVAQQRGVYGIGYNSDMNSFAPKAFLTAAVWNWSGYYTEVAREVKEGNWKSSHYSGDMKSGMVDILPLNNLVPEDVKKLVQKEKEAIIQGKYNVFDGPLNEQDGEEKVRKGETLSVDQLLKMEWLVEGVVGHLND